MIVEYVNPIVETIFVKNGKIVKRVQVIVEHVLTRLYVETPHVMVLKHVVLVRVIVEIVLRQTPIVATELVNIITMKIVCYAQKIVERVHLQTRYVVTEHVMEMRRVKLVQVIALGRVNFHRVQKEKFEIVIMYVCHMLYIVSQNFLALIGIVLV